MNKLGYISKKPITHKTVHILDIVCLNNYPYKPFQVWHKSIHGLLLYCTKPIINSRWFTPQEFNKLKYHLSDSREV